VLPLAAKPAVHSLPPIGKNAFHMLDESQAERPNNFLTQSFSKAFKISNSKYNLEIDPSN